MSKNNKNQNNRENASSINNDLTNSSSETRNQSAKTTVT